MNSVVSKSYCSVKNLVFSDESGSSSNEVNFIEKLYVKISELNEDDYGTYVWPSSVVLAQFIWYHRRHLLFRKSILEIGAGTALPSIVAALCANPKCVIITDKFDNARTSLQLNGISNTVTSEIHVPDVCRRLSAATPLCEVANYFLHYSWGDVTPEFSNFIRTAYCPDIIFGADCFYDPSSFDKVLASIYFLLKSHSEIKGNNSARFFCTYQNRSLDWNISDKLDSWSLQCTHIPLETFNANNCNIACSGMPSYHNIQMMEIALSDNL